jgi:hypothetical protein
VDVPWKGVPIRAWPGAETEKRRASPFRAAWARPQRWGATSTLDLLNREIKHLTAENVLLQMALEDHEIRLDGRHRANASPRHPGVILTFDSAHGPLSYPCDAFHDWQANVHAIALALEALRKVDRYGITKRGEHYTGWRQLPPAGGTTASMTARTAAEIVCDLAPGWDPDESADDVLCVRPAYRDAYRDAAREHHPDRGGSTERFQLLQQARRVLDAHHQLGATRSVTTGNSPTPRRAKHG